MARHRALIFDEEGIARCQSPDFIELDHLNIGKVDVVPINNGAITLSRSNTGTIPGTVPPTNQIHTINGGKEGSVIVLRCQASVAVDNTGNLRLRGNFSLDHKDDTLILLKTGQGTWIELSRSNNG